MARIFTGALDRLINWVVLPVTRVIPFLVSSGIMLVAFAALWVAFGAALIASPAALDGAWRTLIGLPLPVQGLAWLLLLPLPAGLWVWSTDWPLAVRLVLIAGIAGWNLLVFVPRPQASVTALES